MKKIVECVPNFSEGRDMAIIDQISAEIKKIAGVELLDVDPGRDTNRTVVTFAGSPDGVEEAAFQAIKKASELIDMSKHSGAHPRMGATDVCPFVPVAGVTMAECVDIAQKLGRRVAEELAIPVYLYEEAASSEERRSLAYIRAGEYEGLAEKLKQKEFKPDFGKAVFNPQGRGHGHRRPRVPDRLQCQPQHPQRQAGQGDRQPHARKGPYSQESRKPASRKPFPAP